MECAHIGLDSQQAIMKDFLQRKQLRRFRPGESDDDGIEVLEQDGGDCETNASNSKVSIIMTIKHTRR